MRCDPLSVDQVLDSIDGVSFVHNLVWTSMSGKELITSTDWRSKKHIGVDRILCDGRVIFDHGVLDCLSRSTFIKTFCPAIHSSIRSDSTICYDGLDVSGGYITL